MTENPWAFRTMIIAIGVISIAITATIILLATDATSQRNEQKKKLNAIESSIERIEMAMTAQRKPTTPRPREETVPGRTPAKTTRPTTARTPDTRTNATVTKPPGRTTMTPTPHPTPAITTGTGICARNPDIQAVIIETLRISSCRLITNEEMYRIKTDYSLNFTPTPGDFDGLINLGKLSLQIPAGETLQTDSLYGLKKLKELTITLNNAEEQTTTVENGAFRGLDNLKILTIRWNVSSEENRRPQTFPIFEGVETLEQLHIMVSGQLPSINKAQFEHLPNLRTLSIRSTNYQAENNIVQVLRLPPGTLKNNIELKTVQIELNSDRLRLTAHRDEFQHLDQLEHLNIHHYQDSDRQKLELHISPKSPLMKEILNNRQSPQGIHPDTPRSGLGGDLLQQGKDRGSTTAPTKLKQTLDTLPTRTDAERTPHLRRD